MVDAWRTSGTTTQDGDKLDDILEAKAAKVETGGDIDSTSVSWNCLKQDEDQVFGIVVDLLEHPAFSDEKLKLAQQQMATGSFGATTAPRRLRAAKPRVWSMVPQAPTDASQRSRPRCL